MRPTEIAPLPGGKKPAGPNPDRFTLVLVWVAFFLIAALAALFVDIWIRPASEGPVAQAIELASPTPTPSPSPLPSIPPTAAPTALPVVSTPAIEIASPTPETPPPCVPPDDWGIHVVQPGNTLDSLASRYGTDPDALRHVNCLNTDTIFVGQRIYVPGPFVSPTVPTLSAASNPIPAATGTPRPGASATPPDVLSALATLPPTTTPLSPFRINIPDHYVNIVLLGSDKRPQSGAWRTDSMIIVSVDTQANIVRLLSIPRDLWVYIPGHGYNRINTADLWGELARKGAGPEWVKQTIYHNLGIPIHYYVRVDFRGFINIIDTVGGVDVDVDCSLPDINLAAGIHHMDGKDALRYARSRKSTSDFDRGRRQRKVLLALWDQALTMDIIPRLPDLWRSMADSFQTDLPLDRAINLAYVGVQLEPKRILSSAINAKHTQSWVTPQGAAVQLPREDEIRTLLENFYSATSPDEKASKVRIRVLNGSPRREAEELAAATLKWEGFKVAGRGLADHQDYAQTAIFVYNGDLAAGAKIARALQVPASAVQDLSGVAEQPDPANPVDIQVILGQNYDPCQR
jgi:LCP family protein required for cell wall assembly